MKQPEWLRYSVAARAFVKSRVWNPEELTNSKDPLRNLVRDSELRPASTRAGATPTDRDNNA